MTNQHDYTKDASLSLCVGHQYERLLKHVAIHTSACGRVLDVGCGPGHLVRALHRLRYRAYGIDHPDVISAFPSVRDKHGNTYTYPLDLDNLKATAFYAYLPNDLRYLTFVETMVLAHTLGRVRYPFTILKLLLGHFNPDTLIILSPNVRTLHSLWHWLIDKPPVYGADWQSPHYRDFTKSSMRRMVEATGYIHYATCGVECATPFGDFPQLAKLPYMATSFMSIFLSKNRHKEVGTIIPALHN